MLPFPDSLCRAKGLKTTHPEGCDYQFGSRTLQGAIQSLPFPDSLSLQVSPHARVRKAPIRGWVSNSVGRKI
jgi:hypothetical protein